MEPNFDSPKERAERLTQLRKLAKLSRFEIAQLADISIFTYKGWENARAGGIPERRAIKLVDIFQTEGIKTSVDWIMHGIGEPPKKLFYYQNHTTKDDVEILAEQSPEDAELIAIKAELDFFCNNNQWKTISLTVSDDSMTPFFLPGDLVAGVKIPKTDLEKINRQNCIIRTKNNTTLLRQIYPHEIKDFFVLSNLNNNQQTTLHEAELVDIAPVIWLRRKTISPSKTSHKK
ncbi:MAG: hypothetical protein ACD_21C00090G0017 [uncultured bacterium]|nr:MAG: hypothetical protein ACD_21C00090G0017 [uncultured bacterium]